MLEKGEKIVALWMSGSEQAQIAEEVGVSPQTYPILSTNSFNMGTYFPGKPGWNERTQGKAFLKASETCKLSFLSILINVCKERSLYDIMICWSSTP